TGPAGPKRTRVRRLAAGIQGPCLWSANAIAIMSPAGPEPTEADIADHPLASGGSLDQPPNATTCHSLLRERCCAFFSPRFFGGKRGFSRVEHPGSSKDPGCFAPWNRAGTFDADPAGLVTRSVTATLASPGRQSADATSAT